MTIRTDNSLKSESKRVFVTNKSDTNQIDNVEHDQWNIDAVDSKANVSVTNQLRTDVDAKASQSDLNSLTTTVNNKADSATVTTLAGRVTQNETDISSNATNITNNTNAN